MTIAVCLLAGSVALLLMERWLKRLPHFTPREPVEILPLLQPINRADIEAAFQAGDFIPQLEGSRGSRNPAASHELHSRIAVSWACIRRMEENVEVLELEFANQLRSFNRSDRSRLWRSDSGTLPTWRVPLCIVFNSPSSGSAKVL